MADRAMSADEKRCLLFLADLFTKGEGTVALEQLKAEFPLESNALHFMLQMMVEHGAMQFGYVSLSDAKLNNIVILPAVIQMARELDREEPEDLVDKLQKAARSKDIVAYSVIAFFVLAAGVTLINQFVDLLQKLGWMAKP